MHSICVVPGTTALRKLGALAFVSTQAAAYTELDVVFLKQVARHVAVAVDNARNFEQAQSVQKPLSELRQRTQSVGAAVASHFATLEYAEREHIVRALSETAWVIGGPAGAAARLGMKRTTLQSRMRKLGITRAN